LQQTIYLVLYASLIGTEVAFSKMCVILRVGWLRYLAA